MKSSKYSIALVSTTLLGSIPGVDANQTTELANDSLLSKLPTELKKVRVTSTELNLSTNLRIAQGTVSASGNHGISKIDTPPPVVEPSTEKQTTWSELSNNDSSITPVIAQERIGLAIEDFQVPPTLAKIISSKILTTQLKNIVRQCSMKYEIVFSSVEMEEILRRIQLEYKFGDNPDSSSDSHNTVKADKILIPQVFLSGHQLALSAKLLDKKSFSQTEEYHMTFVGHAITDEALCSFWQKIEPNGNFAKEICALPSEKRPTWATSGKP